MRVEALGTEASVERFNERIVRRCAWSREVERDPGSPVRLAEGDVALVSHAHMLRILTARWLGLDADCGRLFRLGTGTLSVLGTEHDMPVILTWNVPPAAFE